MIMGRDWTLNQPCYNLYVPWCQAVIMRMHIACSGWAWLMGMTTMINKNILFVIHVGIN